MERTDRRGARPGERRGGRQKGTPNKKTVEREIRRQKIAQFAAASVIGEKLASGVEQDAMKAAEAVADAARLNTDLATDTLDTFRTIFINRAAFYQPRPSRETREETNPNANEQQFEKWARLACDVAKSLAPYQSPTFRAIVVSPPPPSENKTRRFTLAIFDHHNGDTIDAVAVTDDLADDLAEANGIPNEED